MDNKTSKKALRTEALRLNATKLANNIYEYENKLSEILQSFYANRNGYCSHRIIAYSVGTYGTTGRLDLIEFIDFVANKVEYYYYYY